ncbi:MAG: hypothetical protein QOC72_2865 [Methylobacteriaceae bacterium]|jgi:hypothetical protein|nr:hypothetical protein [Methylobacteriaceae bacterium]
MLERASAGALADAGYMPLREYLRDFPEVSAPSEPKRAQAASIRKLIPCG